MHQSSAAIDFAHIKLDPLLDTGSAAERLHVVPGTLITWRYKKRQALAYIKVGRKVFYRLSELEKFLESRTVRSGEIANG